MSNEVLAATTAADTTVTFVLQGNETALISASGLTGSEVIPIEIRQGTSWGSIADSENAAELTASNNTKAIQGAGKYRLNKPSTSAAVGLYINQNNTVNA